MCYHAVVPAPAEAGAGGAEATPVAPAGAAGAAGFDGFVGYWCGYPRPQLGCLRVGVRPETARGLWLGQPTFVRRVFGWLRVGN